MDKPQKETCLNPELTPILVITLFLVIVAIGIIMLVLLYQKKQLQNIKEKDQLRTAFEREILESKLELQEQTFKNISQEIHDNIGQELIFAKLTLNTIECDDGSEIREKVNNASQLIAKALQDLRNLSKSLNTDYIKDLGLVKAIENELEVIKKTGKYTVRFQVDEFAFYISHQQELILFRIFQEVLNNIVKHSNATEISVQIESSTHMFTMEVRDNGQGFDISEIESNTKTNIGLGIRNMKNRTQMIGGEFGLTAERDKGTLVRISLPQQAGIAAN